VHSVRQGKHFELEIDGTLDDTQIAAVAERLLANPVIEDFVIRPG
jgi:phosphoribosylformylglycinamidine synthase